MTSTTDTTSDSGTSDDVLVRERVARSRTGIAVLALVLITGLLLAWFGRAGERGFLDPDAFNDAGSRAVAELLRDQGVDVVRVTDSASAAAEISASPRPTTLFITIPDLLRADQIDRLRTASPATVVLAGAAGPDALEAWAPGVVPAERVGDDVRDAACAWPVATNAQRAATGQGTYTIAPGTGAISCFAADGRPTVVRIEASASATSAVTVLADPLFVTNEELLRAGNASLALGVLGEHPRVVWYLPTLSEQEAGQASFLDLAPPEALFSLVWIAVVVILLAAWRVRRLGPVVVEPLPAVVRSTETVEGRGRLYRRLRARPQASGALREASVERLTRTLALPRGSNLETLVSAVAQRTGRPHGDVGSLLAGPVPDSDAGLIQLADALDALEREVDRS